MTGMAILVLVAGLLCGGLTSVSTAVAAERIDSAYTKLDLERCAYTPPASVEGTDGGSWRCLGYKGMPVFVAEGDLRMFVSFGQNAENNIAAAQTLPNFNTINETLEWRVLDRGGWRPFATILRWFPQSYDEAAGKEVTGQVLVVTRLGRGQVCHIGYINARKVANANERAREIADTRARTFDCGRDEIIRIGMPD